MEEIQYTKKEIYMERIGMIQKEQTKRRETIPLGGILKEYIEEWRSIGAIEKDLIIDWNWITSPTTQNQVSIKNYIQKEQEVVEMEKIIEEELEEGIIEEVREDYLIFINPIFLVRKNSGGFRKVVDLRKINSCIPTHHFKMEGVGTLIGLMEEGDWGITIDLKSAYSHLPIQMEIQNWL